jgi:hypothetical protein
MTEINSIPEILGLIGTILLCISFSRTEDTHLIVIQTLGNFVWAAHYFTLGGHNRGDRDTVFSRAHSFCVQMD